MILLGLSIPACFTQHRAYRNDVYYKRFFAVYCIVGSPHNTAIQFMICVALIHLVVASYLVLCGLIIIFTYLLSFNSGSFFTVFLSVQPNFRLFGLLSTCRLHFYSSSFCASDEIEEINNNVCVYCILELVFCNLKTAACIYFATKQ